MNKIPCKVCKKPFYPCRSCLDNQNAFYWRGFCCSYECATVYLRRAMKGVHSDSQEEEDEYDRLHKK